MDGDRKAGKTLKDQGYPLSHVTIYRAQHHTDEKLKHMDYVTRSEKFAREHAAMAAVTEEQHHVLKVRARAEHVPDAYKPGEYFYGGPEVVGKVIHRAEVDEFVAEQAVRSLVRDLIEST
jgi:hypothetical protein